MSEFYGYHLGWSCTKCGDHSGPGSGPWTDDTAAEALTKHMRWHVYQDAMRDLSRFMVWVEMEAWTWLLRDANDRAHNLVAAIQEGKLKLSWP